ncbi:zeaxanthin epoxidase, chloroplastic [Typha angustifolia]|uniref:zeaxanthin epoxidase, chloroplastic n=1 Tax=Typha angustifolia TaxID=59011 RepID=UPI003C2D2011
MEAMASPSLAFSNPRCSPRLPSFLSPSFSPLPTHLSLPPSRISPSRQLLHLAVAKERGRSALRCSPSESPSTVSSEKWLLEPVGDGDSRHIGFRVPLPGAFEIASNAVTVGRLSEKADLVIPVATVSGLHARLEKRNGDLLVTDLDSTNGTYINEKKLRPGAVTAAYPGSVITFGDTHLAMFRVSKLEVDTTNKTEEAGTGAEADLPAVDLEKPVEVESSN